MFGIWTRTHHLLCVSDDLCGSIATCQSYLLEISRDERRETFWFEFLSRYTSLIGACSAQNSSSTILDLDCRLGWRHSDVTSTRISEFRGVLKGEMKMKNKIKMRSKVTRLVSNSIHHQYKRWLPSNINFQPFPSPNAKICNSLSYP